MKKIIALLMVLAMVFAVVACKTTPATPDTPDTPATDAPVNPDTPDQPVNPDASAAYKVAMVTDYGDITDESFNQATYEGCKEFCEANNVEFTYKKPSGDSTAERVSAVEAAIDEGFNVIVMPGFAFAGTVVEVAPKYPDTKFIALDVSMGDLLEAAVTAAGQQYDYNPDNWNLADFVDVSNTYCAVYQEELCGYMAGVAAVKLGYKHLGFLGGMAVPAVIRYGYGFVQGANAAAVELGIANEVTVEYVYGNQFFGDADITAYMDTWYQTKGVEVVFACGGGIYTSAVEAAKKVEGSKVIGVDVDQAAIIAGLGGEGMTVTSAMKGLAATVKATLTDVILKDNWAAYAGKVANLGLVSGDDPTVNFVQIPMESTQWADSFTQDDYKALVAKMFAGEITVSNDIGDMPATEITVNAYGNIKG
jgi:basic membrane protein A